MAKIGDKIPDFKVVGVKPGFEQYEEKGLSAFEEITEVSFPGKWKVIFFYPKDFTFVCPTEIAEFARLSSEFAERDAVVLGGSTDNEHCKLAWRRTHKALAKLPIWLTPMARWLTAWECALLTELPIDIRSLLIRIT
jgi:lipoyl-dependent peroxiredoxin subunit C